LRLRDTVWWAWKSLSVARGRTFLTALGIIIGIAAIISLQSVGTGFQENIFNQLFKLNPDTIFVLPSGQLSDVDAIRISTVPGVSHTVPVIMGSIQLYGAGGYRSFSLIGVDGKDLSILIRGAKLAEGRFYYQRDEAVIGWDVAHPPGQPYPFLTVGFSAIGKTVDAEGQKHVAVIRIVGVYEKLGATLFFDPDRSVFVNRDTARSLLGYNGYGAIIVIVNNPQKIDEVAGRIKILMGKKVDVFSASQIRKVYNSISSQIRALLAGIAFISLIVAGVGITNVMLISVIERTREIGVLKAVGYTNRQVLLLFLSEALLIGLMGSIIGILGGVVLAYLSGSILSFRISGPLSSTVIKTTPIFYPSYFILGFSFGILVSLVSGLYPAYRAARMDPVRALRYE
jgi:putative ABC transport system permease protein